MVAKITPLTGSVSVETVGQSLNINRAAVPETPTAPPSVQFQVGANYCQNTYLVDASGNHLQLLSAGQKPVFVSYAPTQVAEFMGIPCTSTKYPNATTLGDLLGEVWDAAINADLAAKAANGAPS